MIKEVPEAKSLRWLANQFPLIDNPESDVDKMNNAIHAYAIAGADKLEEQAELLEEQAEKIRMLEIRANQLTRLNLL